MTHDRLGVTLLAGAVTLDPTVSRSSPSIAIYPAMCQQLYDRNAKQQLVPAPAAAVPVI